MIRCERIVGMYGRRVRRRDNKMGRYGSFVSRRDRKVVR